MSGVDAGRRQVAVIGLPTRRPLRADDDLVACLLDAVRDAGHTLRDDDVVCVASKVVATTEGRTVALPDCSDPVRALAREHAAEIVADAPSVLVTRTAHGHVVANCGIDVSNVGEGHALLLPDDPDTSADRIRADIARRAGVDVAVVVTDTFGRPWRLGQTDVAIGLSGMSAVRDERGGRDLTGRTLQVTVTAVADAVAAAADLARTKASATPFVVVRGVDRGAPSDARTLVRDPADDLFRFGGPTAAERMVAARRTTRGFIPGSRVPSGVLEAAVRAAVTAPAPHHSRPWRFVQLEDDTRTRLLDAMAERWHEDLARDGVPRERIDARLRRSDAVLRTAPTLLAPFVSMAGSHAYGDERRSTAERDLFLLSAGAALQSVQLVLAAHGYGSAWMSSTTFCAPTVREILGQPADTIPTGLLAAGKPLAPPPPRDTPVIDDHLQIL